MNKISFNEKDYNLTRIKRQSKLGNLKTHKPYRVFGAKAEGKVPISIYYDRNKFNLDLDLEQLVNFFRKNKMQVLVKNNDEDSKRIAIGLRRDLRNQVALSSCVLATIIYKLEKRLQLDMDFEIRGIPHFK